MSTNKLLQKIYDYKKTLEGELIIPAHHYQDRDVVALADIVGDSYKLAVDVSKSKAKYILFCGVRFMAEGAATLAKEYQHVIIPELLAGCPMADMIDRKRADQAIKRIQELQPDNRISPIVYMNSYTDVKKFCGIHDGSVCTSSNAERICRYYLNKGNTLFFFPDCNLGHNIADALGLQNVEVARISRFLQLEYKKSYKDVKMFLWDGFCHVHKVFTVSDIDRLRDEHPSIKTIVHPESNREVVQHAGLSGSTAQILDAVRSSEPGSVWGIGTEFHFVQRLAQEFGPETEHNKTILPLRESVCSNMQKTTLEKIADSLESIIAHRNGEGELKTEITVNSEFKDGARKSLSTMISIVN